MIRRRQRRRQRRGRWTTTHFKSLYIPETNTNLLHTNWLHSILRKIGQVIQIIVHQFVHKMSAEKILSEKNWSPFIPRYAGIRRISTKEKKINPI